jgi:hypothetical protein
MLLLKKTFLFCAGVSLILLTGCASKPPAVVAEQAIVGRVPADPPKNPVINADALKAESKSIAVTDIYFKKEGKNLVFIEETRHKTNNNVTSTITPKTVEVDADKADASALTGGANSSQFQYPGGQAGAYGYPPPGYGAPQAYEAPQAYGAYPPGYGQPAQFPAR